MASLSTDSDERNLIMATGFDHLEDVISQMRAADVLNLDYTVERYQSDEAGVSLAYLLEHNLLDADESTSPTYQFRLYSAYMPGDDATSALEDEGSTT